MVLRHVSILRDHPQGYAFTLLKSLNYLQVFKNVLKIKTLNFKILMVNCGVVTAIL